MIKTVIVALYVLFSHTGGVATTSEVHAWTYQECVDISKMTKVNYEESHKGDIVEFICMPVTRHGV